MKKCVLLILTLSAMQLSAQDELNVMTFNIRYDNKADSQNAWRYRKDKAASQILFHKVHVAGLQEALLHQLNDLKQALNNYNYLGVGRAD
jgi:endonuclease/exonuclease/phosphatase family metal-dependent hydrolase